MSNLIDVQILKIEDPGTYWAKEAPGQHMSKEAVDFQRMTEQMNTHFSDEDLVAQPVADPYSGQICIGMRSSDKKWYRVKVQSVLLGVHGHNALCFLLDYAETENINVRNLRHAPEYYLNIPYQAKLFVLEGIQPLTMVTDPEDFMTTTLQPANTWDISAETFVKKVNDKATHRQAKIVGKGENKEVLVKLYMDVFSEGQQCLNDLLVEKQYAMYQKDIKPNQLSHLSPSVSPEPQPDKPASPKESVYHHKKSKSPVTRESGSASSGRESPKIVMPKETKNDNIIFKPAGKMNLYPKKSRIPSPECPPELTGQLQTSVSVQPVAVKPGIGRASSLLATVKNEKRPGSNKQSTAIQQATKESKEQGLMSPEQKSTPQMNGKISPQSVKQHTPAIVTSATNGSAVGRGRAVLNVLRSPGKSNSDGSGDRKQKSKNVGRGRQRELFEILAKDTKKAKQNKAQANTQAENVHNLPNGQQFDDSHKDISLQNAPERPKTPNNVHFSDVDEVLEPRTGATPPSCEAKPCRSILKKSPSIESAENREKAINWKFDDSDSGSDNFADSPMPFKATGVLAGNALLERLKPYPNEMNEKGPHQKEIDPTHDKVLYLGPTKPQPTHIVDDLPYARLVHSMLDRKDVAQLNKLAKYCLHPIQSGRHVAGVSKQNQWNMLAYLFPIVYQLQQTDNYKDLPKGFGPMALVISPSWKKARKIHDCCATISAKLRQLHDYPVYPRVKVIFGGDADDSKEVALMNGCDVLVATPDCLLRMLEKEATSLNRVCHLVFDGADILTKEFTKQVNNIMQRYLQVQQEAKRAAPKQVLAFGKNWDASFSSFCRNFLTSPTIVITEPTEAAIFGHVHLVSWECVESQRVERLLGLLDGTVRLSGKTIVFTTDSVQAENLHEILRTRSLYSLLVHENYNNIQIEEVQREWSSPHSEDSQPVLVATDEVLHYMPKLTDASTVIHFDPPPVTERWCMGRRLWCMRDFFVNRVAEKEAKSRCQTYLFLTSQLGPESQNLVKFLERSYKQVPDMLRKAAERFMNRVEKGKSNLLCEFMKAFGKCRDETRCSSRHVVFRTLDTPGLSPIHQKLPRQGEIKILITHVKNGSCYYARLLQHTSNGKTTPLKSPHFKLVSKMNMHYGGPERRQPCTIPERGKLYAYKDAQHTFHRVETEGLSPVGTHGISEEALIYYVDMGKTETIHTDGLYLLPETLAKVPFQAVEIITCRVRPTDNDTEWTGPATAFMSDQIFNKTLDGTILLAMGNTLWLDTLVERANLKEVGVINTLYNVKSQLLLNGFGEKNNQHLHLLYGACQGRLDLPDGLYNPEHSATRAYTVYGKPLELVVESLPIPSTNQVDGEVWTGEADDYVEVYMSAISTPDLIYLQLGKRQSRWLELQEDINTYIKLTEPQFIEDLKKGTLVLAKFPLEEVESLSWYRGKVMDIKDDGQVDIFFIDTGEQEWVPSSHVQPLITRFLHLPFQAIECSLVHLEPLDKEWSEKVSDFIWDFTRTEGDDPRPKPVYAKVVNHTSARHTGKLMYGVELYDTSKEYNINIGAHLVAKGMASLSSNYVDELFPIISNHIPDSYGKTPVICAAIMRLQDHKTRVTLGLEIFQVVQENMADMALEMGENNVITNLFTVLQYVWDKSLVETICNLLVLLATSFPSNLEHVVERLDVLCELLDHTNDSNVHEALLVVVLSLAAFKRCSHVFLDKGAVRIVGKVLNSSQSLPIRNYCLDVLLVLVKDLPEGSLRVQENRIVKSGCIESACKCLNELYEEDDFGRDICLDSGDIAVSCLRLFEELAKHPGLRDTLRKLGAVKQICAVLGDPVTMPELQDLCIRTLDLLASNNRFNKDKICELGMLPVFNRLIKSPKLSDDTKSLCQSLRSRLEAVKRSQLKPEPIVNGGLHVNRMPKQIKVQGVLLPCPQVPVQSASPETLWAQSKWSILLSLHVPGVSPKDKVANFTPQSVKFYAVANATEYTLELDLYELVVPEKCQVQVCASQVRLGLKKAVKGRWPRLTKLKNKLPYLKVDYDRFLDSSESEDEPDEESSKDEQEEEKPLALALRNNQRFVPFSKLGAGENSNRLVDFNPELMEASDTDSNSSEVDDIMSKPYQDDNNEYFRL